MSMIRNMIGDYLDCKKTTKKETEGPDYVLCGLGTTQLDENPNAQTDKEVYVNQVSASSEVKNYETEFPFSMNLDTNYTATMEVHDIATRQAVGTDAQRDYVRVEMFRPVEGKENVFVARHFVVSVGVTGITGNGGDKIKVSGKFSAVTDAEEGYFNTETKTFTTEVPTV